MKKLGRPYKYTDEQIKAALRETQGAPYLAADRLGCEPDTIYMRAKKNPDIWKLIHKLRGKMLDTAELQLLAAVQRGEPWAIQFALRTLGKDRGYIERTETHALIGKMTDDELVTRIQELAQRAISTLPGSGEEGADL